MLQISNKYVPVTNQEVTDPVTKKRISIGDQIHTILFGRDQLTRKRTEVAIQLRQNTTTHLGQLKGLQPTCDDCQLRNVF